MFCRGELKTVDDSGKTKAISTHQRETQKKPRNFTERRAYPVVVIYRKRNRHQDLIIRYFNVRFIGHVTVYDFSDLDLPQLI